MESVHHFSRETVSIAASGRRSNSTSPAERPNSSSRSSSHSNRDNRRNSSQNLRNSSSSNNLNGGSVCNIKDLNKENDSPLPKYKRDLVQKMKVLRQELHNMQSQAGHCRIEVSREEIFEVSNFWTS
jgi:hypothetical protein